MCISQIGQSFQEGKRLADPLSVGVACTKGGIADRCSQQFEATTLVEGHVCRKKRQVDGGSRASAGDQLTLGRVHLQPNLAGRCSESDKPGADLPVVARKADIIQVANHEWGLKIWGPPTTSSLKCRVQGQRKKEGAQRIALLHPSF